jgi:hypothetical protein
MRVSFEKLTKQRYVQAALSRLAVADLQVGVCHLRMSVITGPQTYQWGKLIMIAYEHELLGKTQGAKACWQSDL